MVTGELDSTARLHDKITLRGVTMSKQPLIAMNDQTSFRSYGGKSKDPPAQIGRRAATAYATALNELLASDKHRQFLGGDTVVFWAEGGGEAEAEEFGSALNPQPDDEPRLRSVMESLSRGALPYLEGITWNREFYVLCLSPNGARISVRFFHTGNFGDMVRRVAEHYENLEIYSSRKEKTKYITPQEIIAEATVKFNKLDEKKKNTRAADLIKDSPSPLGGQLLRTIVTGGRYPMTLYNAMIIQIRGGERINRIKVAVIKATLLRNFNIQEDKEVLSVALNEESTNKAYVLGRMFAVLEKLQQDSVTEIVDGVYQNYKLSTTVRDKFFASACTNPAVVFPTILRLSVHHERKLSDGSKIKYDKLKQNIMDKLDIKNNPYPTTLSLKDQGIFILGYYHQMQVLYPSKNKDDITNEEDDTNV
jgi:CRISPR-associated protein Csd1